ncbi:MAG: hypothetical protein V1907_04090 [Candidatus Kerfeldbacteria bacterium]
MQHALFSIPSDRRALAAVLLLAIVFFITCSIFSYNGTQKFISPDETANYLVTKQYASGKGLALPSSLSESDGIVVPRSFMAVDGALLPTSFLGLPILYGSIARIVGVWVIPFLTPFFSALALIAFFSILKRFMSVRVSLLSTILLAVHPAFWYFSSRGMFHNVLFFDLMVIGLSAMFKSFDATHSKGRMRIIAWYVLSGFSLGFSIAVRTSEVVWLGIIIIMLVVAFHRSFDFKHAVWAMVFSAALPMSVVLYYNHQLFGNALSFGYSPVMASTASVSAAASDIVTRMGQLFFPFGVHITTIAVNIWNYGIRLVWMPALLSMFGLLYAFRQKKTSVEWLYLTIALFIGAWLVVYYGSWIIQDNPDPNAVSIGTSYTRYWLPLYAVMIPYAAYFIEYFLKNVRRNRAMMRVIIIGAITIGSLALVVLDKDEGLASMRTATIEYKMLADAAVAATPPNAVIIAGTGDKIFFPQRRVIVDVVTPQQYGELRELITKVPVYLYVHAAQSPITVTAAWEQRGFGISEQINLADYDRLFTVRDLYSLSSS